jgi:cysteinyl-tRNA synthetase
MTAPLRLFNSLTRETETFHPIHPGEARVYTCGPTVYNYPHIGNMRAYVFADILGRALSWKGYKLTHVINITDVGHLTDDADAGEDKLEKAAAERAQSIWDIARHYTEAYWADIKALGIRQPAHWSIATDYVPAMIEFAKSIAEKHCYELEGGLYFDVSTVADYGRLAREDDLMAEFAKISSRLRSLQSISDASILQSEFHSIAAEFLTTLRAMHARKALKKYRDLIEIWDWADGIAGEGLADHLIASVNATRVRLHEGRIDAVEGKRNEEDFAIWRKTPAGETRQMEWDSPWGRGAPGWHLECSVMSGQLLGFPFDVHTGGIDHREIHHPNEIAQNQAFCCTGPLDVPANSGARVWMHNNFLVERSGKMSKSAGEFLRLQLLIDKGYSPLAFRMMCLQAHYRSELEFSWDGLGAALTRLKRLVMAVETVKARFAEKGEEAIAASEGGWTLDTAVDEVGGTLRPLVVRFDQAVSDDLNTAVALTVLEELLSLKKMPPREVLAAVEMMDSVLGLGLLTLARVDLRLQPKDAAIGEIEIEDALARRKAARAEKDFASSDAIRDALAAQGVEAMDGDPLGWEWKL